MNSPFSLKGKTILISGASSGIGRATAIECAKAGASCILLGRSEARLIETFTLLNSDNNKYYIIDLLKNEDLNNLIEKLEQLDGIVLCAGIGVLSLIPFSNPAKVKEVFEVNFFAQVELLRLIIKKKKINIGGSIVAISSLGGTNLYTIGNGIYGASKAALDSYMKFCARELAPQKIRVNSILPGMIETPFIHNGKISEQQHKTNMENFPLKRYGKPEEVAYAIIYLLSDAAAWVTGTSLVIDGGRSLV